MSNWRYEFLINGRIVSAREFWLDIEQDIVRNGGDVEELFEYFKILANIRITKTPIAAIENAIAAIESTSMSGGHEINLIKGE